MYVIMYYLHFDYSVAENVEMVDESFSPHEFEIVHGLLNVSWDRLPK